MFSAVSSVIPSRLARLLLAGAALALMSGAASAGPKAYVGNFADSTVSVIDTADGKVVATVPVATGPHGMAIAPDGRTVYVTGDGSSSLSIIDTSTDRVAKTVEVGKAPNGITLTPDGKFLLVTVYAEDRVAFLDTATQAVVASVAVPKPHTVSISPDGKLAYVTTQDPGHFALTVVDLAARTVARSIPLEKTPRDAEFGHDGKFYFTQAGVSAVAVLDPASDKIVAEIQTGVSPHFVNVFHGAPLGMVVVQGPGEVLLFDPATDKPVRSIAVGKQPHWIDASADGKRLYVSNEGSNTLSVIDPTSGAGEIGTVAVGNAPRKVAVQRAHSSVAARVSIENFAFGPALLKVTAGQSVQWTNADGAPHGLAFKDGAPGTDLMLPGQTFSRRFERPGVYDYVCSVHPYMVARVTVQAP